MAANAPIEKPDDTVARGPPAFPGAEDILGFWTAWTQNVSRLASDQGSPAAPPVMDMGRITPDRLSGDLLQRGVRQLGELLARDPVLLAFENALNANPLRKVIPVDWAEI